MLKAVWWWSREDILTPNFQENPLHGLACVDVDDLKVKIERDANLIIDDLTANRLAGNI